MSDRERAKTAGEQQQALDRIIAFNYAEAAPAREARAREEAQAHQDRKLTLIKAASFYSNIGSSPGSSFLMSRIASELADEASKGRTGGR